MLDSNVVRSSELTASAVKPRPAKSLTVTNLAELSHCVCPVFSSIYPCHVSKV